LKLPSQNKFGEKFLFEWTSSTSDDEIYVSPYVNSLICTIEKKLLELMATCPTEAEYTARVKFWLRVGA